MPTFWLLTPSRNNCPFFPGEDCVLWLRMGDYMPVSPGEGKSLLPECHGFGEELLPSYESGPSIFPYLGKSILCLHSSKGLERCHLWNDWATAFLKPHPHGVIFHPALKAQFTKHFLIQKPSAVTKMTRHFHPDQGNHLVFICSGLAQF